MTFTHRYNDWHGSKLVRHRIKFFQDWSWSYYGSCFRTIVVHTTSVLEVETAPTHRARLRRVDLRLYSLGQYG